MTTAILDKSILKVMGENSKKILDGLITQDINNISISKPIYALFLNNKGRVLFNTIIYMQSETEFLLEIEPELLMDLAKHIHKYDIEKTCEFAQEEKFIAISDDKLDNFMPDPRSTQLPYRAVVNENNQENKELLSKYQNLMLKLAIPSNFDFIREKSLANDLNTEDLNGISFTKGCYLGQEITSKTKHIKPTKNKLVSLKNSIYNVNQNNLTVYNKLNEKIGQTFSYDSEFVLAIIKRVENDLDNLIIKE